VADAVIRNANVKDAVTAYRRGFLEMHYCLPLQEAVPAAARLFAGISPTPGFAERFAENLSALK
jgi:hypothetical protein